MAYPPDPVEIRDSNVEAMRDIFEDIIRRENEVNYSPIGITGDPDCPYRDWRGTPIEVGCTVVFASGSYSGSITMTEGEVLTINEKPAKKNSTAQWKFTITVAIKNAAGRYSNWKTNEIMRATNDGKVKKQAVVAVDRVTVVF